MTICIEIRRLIIINLDTKSVSELVKIFNVSKSTIYNLKKLENLVPQRKRTEKLDITMNNFIKEYVIKRVNFNYKNLLKLIKEKFDKTICKSTLYSIIKKLNITRKKIYRKPLYSTKSKLRKNINTLKSNLKNVNANDIISIDETSIDTHIGNTYGWSSKGVIINKFIKNQRIRYTVICAVTNKQIYHYKIIKNSADGNVFLEFIKELKLKIGNNKKVLLLDNARIHHYKLLKTYMNDLDNLKMVYNVPYCPQFNPIEYVFNECKQKINRCNITNKNIITKIKNSFKIKKANLQAYFKKSLETLRNA